MLMANMVPPSEENKMRDKRGKEALAQATNMIMVVSINFLLIFFSKCCVFFPYCFSFLMQSAMAVAWAYQDCERPLDLYDKRAAKVNLLKERVAESEKNLTAKEEELKANEV